MKAQDLKPGTFFHFKSDGAIYLKTTLGQAVAVGSGRILQENFLNKIDVDVVEVKLELAINCEA